MKKHLIVIGMTLMLLAVGLSGCFDITEEKSKVLIYDVDISHTGYFFAKTIVFKYLR